MSFPPFLLLSALRTGAVADTLVARMIPERSLLDWTNGILQLVVLVLGVATLVTMVMLLVTVRRGIGEVSATVKQMAAESRPLMSAATTVVTDAREVVAMLRTDVERVTEAASAVSEQLLDVADRTAERVDEITAVLDVLQDELEGTAITAVAAVRGMRVAGRTLTRGRGDVPDARPDTR